MLHRDFSALDDSHFIFGHTDAAVTSSASVGDSVVVPDAHLLFTAEFTRSGSNDLKLTGEDGQTFLVRDYFKTDKHPTLQSPNGGVLTADVIDALVGPLNPGQYAQAAAPQAAATPIGHVASLSGNVTVVRNGVAIALNNGDAVLKGDVVQTGSDGKVGIVFADGSAFNLSASARMVLNEFVFDPNGTGNSEIVNLIQGSLSFVSGQIAGAGGNMQIKTPAATMGIRGTSGQADLVAQDGETLFSVYSEDGFHSADIFDNQGNLIARATSTGGLIRIRNGSASETSKSVEQKLIELSALNAVLQTKSFVNQFFQNQPDTKTNPDDHTNANPNSTGTSGTSIIPSDGIKLTFTDIGKTPGGPITVGVHGTGNDGTQQNLTIVVPPVQNPKPVFVNEQTITQIVNGQTITQISAGEHLESFGPRLSNNFGTSTPPWLAGRYVVFIGAEALPGPNDNTTKGDIFIYDRLTQTLKSMTVGHLVPHDGETFQSLPSISADGHWAVFQGHWQTTETTLDQNNQTVTWTQEHSEIYLYDAWTDTTKLLVSNGGGDPQISANGNFVLFQSGSGFYDQATNTNHNQQDIIVTDRDGVTKDDLYVDVVTSGNSGSGHDALGSGSISADGRFVTFWSTASQLHSGATVYQLDNSGFAQVYLYDRVSHTITEVTAGGNNNSGSLDPSGDGANDWPSGVSADGRYVVFQSDASNLVANDVNGHSDIFLYDTLNKTTQLVSKDLTNVAANFGDSFRPEISPDGRYIIFVSSASDLVAGDTNGQTDAFLYDRLTGKTSMLSIGPNGTPSNGDSEWGTTLTAAAIFLAFGSTATNLTTPGGGDPTSSIYLVDRSFINTVTLVDNGGASPTLTQTGELSFNDVNDTHTVSFKYVNEANTPIWSSFSTNTLPKVDTTLGITAGVIDYSVTVNESLAASLLPGQTHTDVVAVTITDSAGGQAVTDVYITIAGNDILQVLPQSESRFENDTPVIVDLLAGVSSNHTPSTPSGHFEVTNFIGSATLDGVHIDIQNEINAGGILFEYNGQIVTQADKFDTIVIDPSKFSFLTEGQTLKLVADYGVWDGYTTAHDTATFTIVGQGNFDGAQNLDLHNVVLHGTRTILMGGSDEGNTLVTSWHHLDGVTTYDGGDVGGGDAVTLVFSPTQLEQILTTDSFRNELQSYLDGNPGDGVTADTLDLAGSDWNAIVKGFETARIALATGDDYVTYNAIGDTLPPFRSDQTATGGNNTLIATPSHPDLVGGPGNDILVATSGGSVLQGGPGFDLLLGNNGADTLRGGTEGDIMWGGAGADTFQFTETLAGSSNFGKDTILDFTPGQDIIQFASSIFGTPADVLANITVSGHDLVITAGASDVTLKNLALSSLHASDFHIV